MPDTSKNERQEKFLSLFKYFDNTKKACEWIGKATMSSPATVAVWRCSGPSAYGIPERPYKMLMDKIKRSGLPKSGR
jgi:hypothetical protein